MTEQEIIDEQETSLRNGKPISRTEIQTRQSIFARAKAWVSPRNAYLEKSRRAEEAAKAARERAERELTELIERRETLVRNVEQIYARLKRGRDQIAQQPSVDDQVRFFKSVLGIADREDLLTARAGAIATLKEFHTAAGEWLVEIEAELNAAETALRDFDKLHKVKIEIAD